MSYQISPYAYKRNCQRPFLKDAAVYKHPSTDLAYHQLSSCSRESLSQHTHKCVMYFSVCCLVCWCGHPQGGCVFTIICLCLCLTYFGEILLGHERVYFILMPIQIQTQMIFFTFFNITRQVICHHAPHGPAHPTASGQIKQTESHKSNTNTSNLMKKYRPVSYMTDYQQVKFSPDIPDIDPDQY